MEHNIVFPDGRSARDMEYESLYAIRDSAVVCRDLLCSSGYSSDDLETIIAALQNMIGDYYGECSEIEL